MRGLNFPVDDADNMGKEIKASGGDMNCKNCPDREICFNFNLLIGKDSRNYNQLKDAYLRTMRCRRQKFG
jgi:hypothetical protein